MYSLQEIFDEYLSHIVYTADGNLKSISTLDGFWAAMNHAHRLVLEVAMVMMLIFSDSDYV